MFNVSMNKDIIHIVYSVRQVMPLTFVLQYYD